MRSAENFPFRGKFSEVYIQLKGFFSSSTHTCKSTFRNILTLQNIVKSWAHVLG